MMITTRTRDSEIHDLRRRLEAAESQRAAEERRNLTYLKRLQKVAGINHSRLAIALYELLDIRPEHGSTRVVQGKTHKVTADRDETVRTQRVFDMISALVDTADASVLAELRRTDETGRDARKPRAKQAEAPEVSQSFDEFDEPPHGDEAPQLAEFKRFS